MEMSAFVFVTDDVVISHQSPSSLIRVIRRDYNEMRKCGDSVTHVALGPQDGMYEVGTVGNKIAWKIVKMLCRQRHAAVHGVGAFNINRKSPSFTRGRRFKAEKADQP